MPVRGMGKGPWTHRFMVFCFSAGLAILIYWLLSFVLSDIGKWPGPDYAKLEQEMIDTRLLDHEQELADQIQAAHREMQDQQQRQQILRASTEESQRTMNQLLDFQRLNLEKGVQPSEDEQKALAESERLFLANQREFQQLNARIGELNERLRDLREQQRLHESQLAEAREPVHTRWQQLQAAHEWKVAAVKLAVLVPLLLAAVIFFWKGRQSIYAPLVYAAGGALVIKVGQVMHHYFPTAFFKYILVGVAIAVVLRILVALLRMAAFPRSDWLLKQYREAYQRFVCPVCDYPIRRGPLKYAFWSRRTVRKLLSGPAGPVEPDAPYTCPLCGTRLFEECGSCGAVRHSLLPACERCGGRKPLEPAASEST